MSIFLPMMAYPPLIKRTLVTWNPADKGPTITLSNGNLTAAVASGAQCVRATLARASGKYYFEFTADGLNVSGQSPYIGLDGASDPMNVFPPGAWIYGLQNGAAVHSSPIAGPFTTFGTGDRGAVALDAGAQKLWFAHANTWINGGDPVAGTSPMFTGVTGTLYPIFYGNGTPSQVTIRMSAASFLDTVPSGYLPWQI